MPETKEQQRSIALWMKNASPRPWRIDRDNAQGIEIVAANGDLVAIEDFGGIPSERGMVFAEQIIESTRANFHMIVEVVNSHAY